ncbi:MAG: hydrolase of the alpha/beta superfamily [Myxococcaceae bacterium]|nr:hydrolase of the alpha/beta superfamily [Myxococcaceae bacterium]
MATDFILPARDDFPLGATLFEAEVQPRQGVVVVNSATAVKRTYYAKFAAWLASQGYDVITYDYRGIGGSRPPGSFRDFKGTLTQWGAEDFAGALEWACRERRVEKVLVIGHSVGGQLLGLAHNVDRVSAALCVASQSGDWRLWPTVAGKARMALYMYALLPAVGAALGYVPGRLGMGEDLPHTVAREWARWCRTRGYLLGDDGSRRALYERIKAPILAISFTDDTYAPKETVAAWLGFFPRAQTTHRHQAPADSGSKAVGHFGFFRASAEQTLWPQAAQWLAAQR